MQIQFKNFKFYPAMSEETNAFTAEVVVDGVTLLSAKNEGRGGSTFYHLIDHSNSDHRALLQKAETYWKEQPPINYGDFSSPNSLENQIDELVEKTIEEQEKSKFAKKREKAYETAIVYGSETEFAQYYFTRTVNGKKTNTKVPIAEMLANANGRASLQRAIERIKAELLRKGEKIWNTNIPTELLK